eukprot:TRINITY_DN105395_c1_g1_i1.p1 TRINITY_DN105395_c1_g1~~TRINITY_DN105395_c1_g1_i1.p1  ORF type:complete len:364 (+),score=22.62 TRINITY_DN105395_c1_g1_i1:182-1273(+)
MERTFMSSSPNRSYHPEGTSPSLPRLPRRLDSYPPSPIWELPENFDWGAEGIFSAERFGLFSTTSFKRDSFPAVPQSNIPNMPPLKPLAPEHSTEKQRKRRKRKAPQKSESQERAEEEKTALRAEKNRRFAKESRERKKEYIKSLEEQVNLQKQPAQVKQLKEEVEYYKKKLSAYEWIEKQKDVSMSELYKMFSNYREKLASVELFEESEVDMHNISAKYMRESEERRKAIMELSRTFVSIVAPITHKYLLWSAEKDLGHHGTSSIASGTGAVSKGVLQSSVRSTQESKRFFASCARQVRSLIKDFITCQRGIQEMIMKIDWHIYQFCLPLANTQRIISFVQKLDRVSFHISYSLVEGSSGVE